MRSANREWIGEVFATARTELPRDVERLLEAEKEGEGACVALVADLTDASEEAVRDWLRGSMTEFHVAVTALVAQYLVELERRLLLRAGTVAVAGGYRNGRA